MALCTSDEASEALKAEYTNPDGSLKYADVDAYLAQDANYQALVDKYEHPQYLWTKDQMLHAIRNAIINKESGVTTETQRKVANVQGKDVTLIAKGVGTLSDETTEILYSDLAGGTDAAVANLKLLANADAEDVTVYDGKGNVLNFATDAGGKQVVTAMDAEGKEAETDGKIYKFVINNLSPLGVKATGQVNITAHGDNAFIAGRSDEKGVFSPINTGIITAAGQDVRLYTQEGIYNTLKGAADSYGNIHAKNLIAYGGAKDIGASDKYLGVALSGDLLTAAADGSIYIRNMLATEDNGVLRVGSLYAGDTIALESSLGIAMTQDPDYAQAYLNAGKQLQFNVNTQDGTAGSKEAPLRILNSGGTISLTAGEANLKGVKGLLGEDTSMKLGEITTAGDFTADSEGKLETTGSIQAGKAIDLSGQTGVELNNDIAAGQLGLVEDMTYVGGGPVTLRSQKGSIIQTEGGIRAAKVTTFSAGEVLLMNEQNTFRNVSVNGTNKNEQDEDSIYIDAIDGGVTVFAHGGSNLETAIPATVYGDVTLRNLDDGSLTVTTDIEAKEGKNGEDGSVVVQQQGDIVMQGALKADGDVEEWAVNGTAIHTGDIRTGKNVNIAGGDGISMSGLSLEAVGTATLKALDGPMHLEKTQISGSDVELFGDGEILEVKDSRISSSYDVKITEKTGDISLDGNIIQAGRSIYVRNEQGNITDKRGTILSASDDVALYNATGDIAMENARIEAGHDIAVETESGNIRMRGSNVKSEWDITVGSQGGDISLINNEVIAGRNLTLETAGNGSLDVAAGSEVMSAGQDVSLAAEDGMIRVRDNLNPVTATNGNVSIVTTGGNIVVTGRVDAGNNLTAESESGDIAMTGSVTAKKDIKGLSLGGDITVTDRAQAGQDLILRTEQDGMLNLLSSVTDPALKKYDITSGRDVVLVADNGAVNINNRVVAPRNFGISTNAGDITIGGRGSVEAKTDVTVNTDSGNVSVTGNVTGDNFVNVETVSGNVTVAGNVKAGSEVNVKSVSGDIGLRRDVTAGLNIRVESGDGSVGLMGNISAGSNIYAAAGGDGELLIGTGFNGEGKENSDVTAGRSVYLTAENGKMTVDGKVTAVMYDVNLLSGNGEIAVDGDVEAGANVNTSSKNGDILLHGNIKGGNTVNAVSTGGNIVYGGNVEAGRDITGTTGDGYVIYGGNVTSKSGNVTAESGNGGINYFGNVEAGNRVTAEAGTGWIWYDGNVSAGRNVTAAMGTGNIVYADSVSAGENVEAKIAQKGDIIYLGIVNAGRNVIADTVMGNIYYGSDVNAGHSVSAHTGLGTIAYMGKVIAGKDLPEQIRDGYGKIAYYDRYGLVGYSDAFDVAAPVRNASAEEIEKE